MLRSAVLLCLLSCILKCEQLPDGDYITFGGYVQWKQSNTSIREFAPSLKVHLYNEGVLREVFSVLPNGAYSVVVSSKGNFNIKLAAPNGWNFSPKDGFDIKINDAKSPHENYIFYLTGFDVTGMVITMGMDTGPPNLYVSIYAGKDFIPDSSLIVGQNQTTADGSFFVSSISPGEYIVLVSDQSTISRSGDIRASAKIVVSSSLLQISDPLVLQGHFLTSRISFAGEAVINVSVLLYIPKESSLSPDDLGLFGCHKVLPSSSYPLPAELSDKVLSTPLCKSLTDAEGVFSFSRLAGGEYYLVPLEDLPPTPDSRPRFIIKPTFLTIRMAHSDLNVTSGFQVTGFWLRGGSVRHASGTPISGVEIWLDGNLSSKTDASGSYELEITKPGDHIIEAKYPKLEFLPFVVNLSPRTDHLPLLVPSAVQVCGRFLFAPSASLASQDLPRIEFENGAKEKRIIMAIITADKREANFCVHLSPEMYSLRLIQSRNDFIKFSPTLVNVNLISGPVNDLLFTQFQANIEGEVICSTFCSISNLAVRLISSVNSDPEKFSLTHLRRDPSNALRFTYSIEHVFPGAYTIELVALTEPVDESSPTLSRSWCWSAPSNSSGENDLVRTITVVDKDLHFHDTPTLIFTRTGFPVHVEAPIFNVDYNSAIHFSVNAKSSKPASSNLTDERIKSETFHYRLESPLSIICLPNGPQNFFFQASTDCLRLGSPIPDSLHLSANISDSAFTIKLPVAYLPLNVRVDVSSEFSHLSKLRLPQLVIEYSKYTPGENTSSTVELNSTWEKSDKYVARTESWIAPGEKINLTVKPLPGTISDVYPLLVPSSRVLQAPGPFEILNAHSTQVQVRPVSAELFESAKMPHFCSNLMEGIFKNLSTSFIMQPGFFFKGSITPAVSKVLVSVFVNDALVSSSDESTDNIDLTEFVDLATTKFHDRSLVTRTLTDRDGVFMVGPFYFHSTTGETTKPSSLLTLRLQKPGYEIMTSSQILPGFEWTFNSRKLALVELKTVTEANKILANVLVTIIGTAYRRSETTDAKGMVRFIGLPPGEYYLQPLLKEYSFLLKIGEDLIPPTERAIAVADGGSLALHLVGKRVAFSAIGQVTSLSDLPEAGVMVEAKLLSYADTQVTQTVYPEITSRTKTIPCSQSAGSNLLVPVEQTVTDSNGTFSLRGLFPGCLYSLSVNYASAKSSLNSLSEGYYVSPHRSVPKSITVRTFSENIHGILFLVFQPLPMNTISAIVDTTDEYLQNLVLVVHPVNQPQNVIIRHKFASESLLFCITGQKLETMIGKSYTILLETNFNFGAHEKNSTVQMYNFDVHPTTSSHFKFSYRPHPAFMSATTRV